MCTLSKDTDLPLRSIMDTFTPYSSKSLRPCRLRSSLYLYSRATRMSSVTWGFSSKNSMILWLHLPQGLQDKYQVIEHGVVYRCSIISQWSSKKMISAWTGWSFVQKFFQELRPPPQWISYRRLVALGWLLSPKLLRNVSRSIVHLKYIGKRNLDQENVLT